MREDLILRLADRNRTLPGWADKGMANAKFDRDTKELPRYAQVEERFKKQAQSVVADFASGKINRKEAMKRFKGSLYQAETEAFVAGKRSAGKRVYFVTPGEQKMLTGRHSRNMRYFSRFLRQIEAGTTRMPIAQRAGLYASSLWSLYNRGQVDRDWDDDMSPNTRYHWVMDPDAEHCDDCVERWRESEKKGGYTWDELIEIGFPGEGTRCMVRCRCHVRVVKKRVVTKERIASVKDLRSTKETTPEEAPEESTNRDAPEAPVEVDDRTPVEAIDDAPEVKLLKRVLGGDNMPLRVPAAGIPPVKIKPAVVAESIAKAGSLGDELAKGVPKALNALIKPREVIDQGTGTRTFFGDGIAVTAKRDPESGTWFAVMIVLVDGKDRPRGDAYVAPW